MAPGSNLIWTFYWDSVENEYIPCRQSQRITRSDKQYKNRAAAQNKCDELNSKGYEPIRPLEIITDRTKN